MPVSRTLAVFTVVLFIAAMLVWRQIVTAIVDNFGLVGAAVTVGACYLIAVRIDRSERSQRP